MHVFLSYSDALACDLKFSFQSIDTGTKSTMTSGTFRRLVTFYSEAPCIIFLAYFLSFYRAAAMHARYSYEQAVCLSGRPAVCQTRDL